MLLFRLHAAYGLQKLFLCTTAPSLSHQPAVSNAKALVLAITPEYPHTPSPFLMMPDAAS